ncbi:MAG: glutamate--tRNA ligase [Rhodospirillaceae bacterium]|nr:glutamate--tRNA ligase [Rhodospirillaceae bacterium]
MTAAFRFAPSPTGYLHIGNARPAVINWLFARKVDGRFVLRIDDTDTARSKPEFTAAIEQDLAWLGLDWDDKIHQSARLDSYRAAAERLRAMGLLYPCYETPDELEMKRKLQLKAGKPPLYKRADHHLTDAARAAFEADGRRPHWRFAIAPDEIAWDDLVRGPCVYHGEHLTDPVLVRADGTFLYMMPSVVDDIDLGMTHIVRGEDHVTNTALQVQIWRALTGAPVPAFAHLPLLVDAAGKGLSKRSGSLALRDLREAGLESMAIASLVAKIGSSDAIEPRATMAQLIAEFDIAHFGRATPKFDPHDLEFLNAKVLHELPFADARPRLAALGIDDAALARVGDVFWTAVRGNLKKFSDAAGWWAVCFGAHAPSIEDTTFVAEARTLLPDEPWSETTWHDWTERVKAATGRKGKGLFLPLRLALTGLPHGPEMKALLPLIGRARAEKRLMGVTA